MRANSGSLAFALCVLLYGGTAVAATNEALHKAKQFYMGLQFDKAAVQLDKALRFANRYGDLVEIYELQGLTWAALGKNDEAREAFAHLLMIAPEHALPDYVAPRMTKPMKQARAEYAAGGWLSASAKGPSTVYPGDPITVEVRLVNDPFGMADRFRISFRVAGATEVRSNAVRAGPLARVGLDIDLAGREPKGAIEYWVTVLDSFGGELYFIGSEQEPLAMLWEPRPQLALTPSGQVVDLEQLEPAPPFYETWWFWTAVGVVVAGAAVGITLAVMPEAQDCDPSTMICGAVR
jgi:tetratricopeptide (TPR) repeat protein